MYKAWPKSLYRCLWRGALQTAQCLQTTIKLIKYIGWYMYSQIPSGNPFLGQSHSIILHNLSHLLQSLKVSAKVWQICRHWGYDKTWHSHNSIHTLANQWWIPQHLFFHGCIWSRIDVIWICPLNYSKIPHCIILGIINNVFLELCRHLTVPNYSEDANHFPFVILFKQCSKPTLKLSIGHFVCGQEWRGVLYSMCVQILYY
jgi:hypothetical protein